MKLIKYFVFITYLIFGTVLANIKVSPAKIFLEYPKRSTSIEIINTQNIDLDVWIEYKYGYTVTDDSNNYVVIVPDKLSPDDKSAVDWIKIYPEKFVLSPYEKRNVRIIVNPPSNIEDGEYWSRIIINNKKIGRVFDLKKTVSGATVGFEIQHQQSLPFHFRKGKVYTDISIAQEPLIEIKEKKIYYKLSLNRIGNSSYWGIINFIITDKSGKKIIKKEWQPLVVYKNIEKQFIIDLKDVNSGEYVVNVNIESKRYDEVAKYIIKTEPKSWKYNVRIQ